MTMPTPAQLERTAERIVAAALAMRADPDNMDRRRDYMRATFNHDFTAAAIAHLAAICDIGERELPWILERAKAGVKLTPAERAAATGYEVGWRDGRNEARQPPVATGDAPYEPTAAEIREGESLDSVSYVIRRGETEQQAFERAARAEIVRLRQQIAQLTKPSSPGYEDDWVMVPREPTREMWAAMGDAFYGHRNRHHDAVAQDFWTAALSKAPPPPKAGV